MWVPKINRASIPVAITTAALLAFATVLPTAIAEGHDLHPCPDAEAIPLEDGPIRLQWTLVDEDVDGYTVFKNIIIGAPPHQEQYVAIATLGPDETSYTDEDTTLGAPHQYSVVAAVGEEADVTCPILEATAIPFFGTPLLAGLGIVAAGAGYALMKRQRQT